MLKVGCHRLRSMCGHCCEPGRVLFIGYVFFHPTLQHVYEDHTSFIELGENNVAWCENQHAHMTMRITAPSLYAVAL